MGSPYIGQIILVGFNFAPTGYLACNGQLLPIAQYDTLFALIGTTYGGDGQTTFALPDLRGRLPIGTGQGPGLQNYILGEFAGTEAVTIVPAQLPPHTHAPTLALTATSKCKVAKGNRQSPMGNVPAIEATGVTAPYSSDAPDANMHAAAVTVGGPITAQNAGGNQQHSNLQPTLSMNFCIAFEGIFPPQ